MHGLDIGFRECKNQAHLPVRSGASGLPSRQVAENAARYRLSMGLVAPPFRALLPMTLGRLSNIVSFSSPLTGL